MTFWTSQYSTWVVSKLQNGVREKSTVMYNTSLGRIFGVEKYAKELMKVVEAKNIKLNVRHNLIKLDPLKQIACFELLDDNAKSTGKTVDFHVSSFLVYFTKCYTESMCLFVPPHLSIPQWVNEFYAYLQVRFLLQSQIWTTPHVSICSRDGIVWEYISSGWGVQRVQGENLASVFPCINKKLQKNIIMTVLFPKKIWKERDWRCAQALLW